jgi:hypothetical protein
VLDRGTASTPPSDTRDKVLWGWSKKVPRAVAYEVMAAHTLTSQDASVRRWRIARLREAGFEGDLASALADHRGVDLHALLNLIDRGCPPALAARILAPLDFEGPLG